MNVVLRSVTTLLLFVLFSCQGTSKKTAAPVATVAARPMASSKDPVVFSVDPEAILKNFDSWYRYTYTNIRLAQDFIGLDVDSAVLSKGSFLDRLQTGRFVPLKWGRQGDTAVYRLHHLSKPERDIKATIRQMAETEREHFEMEGKPLPRFDFTDLNGRQYNPSTTKGKTLVLKCWFINCFACVQEFPQLNRVVDRFRQNDRLLFISLATDGPSALRSFLTKKSFHYAVVPNQGHYLDGQLHITAYPTHLLVDKNGVIVKVTNSMDDLLPFLQKQAAPSTVLD